MKIIIAGAGKVGSTLAHQLSFEGHDLTIIDSSNQVLNASIEKIDAYVVHGNCAAMSVLLEAGVKEADLLIAATNADEVNLLCCTTAHGLNPKLHTIARIRNPEYTDQIYEMRSIFALSMAINPERQAASEIHRLLRYPGFLRRDIFAKGRTEIVELRIDKTSKLLGASLGELPNIIKCRILICAVLRNGTALVPNSGSFTFQEGDRVFVTAPSKDLAVLLRSLGILTRRARRVILCGGGRLSIYLADMLEKDGISVQLIDNNPDRCRRLAELLPNTQVICGDATDQTLLADEGIDRCDELVSLTGVDELNMIISLYANSRQVSQVITKLSHADNRIIIDSLALGSIVCPKELCCNNIVRYVRAMQNQTGAAISVHAIADGQVEAMEFLVDENTKGCGVPLKNLNPRANVLIASITHGSKTEIPNGDSMFHQGDTVVVVTTGRGAVQQLNDIFV
ncbi:MAG: Trk system potassium transporter TrkA [Faecousia sp.]